MFEARVFRTIDRPLHMFGLEFFDASLWLCTWFLVKWRMMVALPVIAGVWLALFLLRLNKPPKYLEHLVRFHAQRLAHGHRYDALRRARYRRWLGGSGA